MLYPLDEASREFYWRFACLAVDTKGGYDVWGRVRLSLFFGYLGWMLDWGDMGGHIRTDWLVGMKCCVLFFFFFWITGYPIDG